MTYKEILPIWWSAFWRGVILGSIAGFAIGFVLGFICGALGYEEYADLAGQIGGWLVGVPISIWALREAIIIHQINFSA